MSTPIKSARKPISAKGTPKPYAGYYEQSFLDVDPSLKAEIKAKGLEYRFIDRKKYQAEGNRHRHHWAPYQVDNAARGTMSVDNAPNADGLIVRGGLVLATRPIELGDAHRDFIERKRISLHGKPVETSRGRFEDAQTDGDDEDE